MSMSAAEQKRRAKAADAIYVASYLLEMYGHSKHVAELQGIANRIRSGEYERRQ